MAVQGTLRAIWMAQELGRREALAQGITAVVCGSDVLALGAIRAVRRAGLDVPRDVSVVGFDDSTARQAPGVSRAIS